MNFPDNYTMRAHEAAYAQDVEVSEAAEALFALYFLCEHVAGYDSSDLLESLEIEIGEAVEDPDHIDAVICDLQRQYGTLEKCLALLTRLAAQQVAA
jgi:hypothetical protein